VKDVTARDTIISINGVTATQSNTEPITVNGITYSYFATVAPGGSALTSTITIYDPNTVSNSAIVSDPPLITGSPTTFSSNTPASSFTRQVTSVALQSNASVIAGSGLNINQYSVAHDAQVTIGGIQYQRSSNVISDIIPKVTFTLMGGVGTANVNISWGQDNSEKAITDLSDAYNAVIKAYNTMTANNSNSKTPGTFATSPTTLAFIESIKRRFATGATYNIGSNNANGNPYILSLASLGLDYQLDGTLKYNSISYLTSQANGLRDKFLKGLRIGYISATDNLMTFVKAQSGLGGALAQEMKIEKDSINSLTKEKDNLQTRLDKIQSNYIAQYSGLNTLLFQLNSKSTDLGSALNALTNMSTDK
jgi:flagellar hook-associated protein 2